MVQDVALVAQLLCRALARSVADVAADERGRRRHKATAAAAAAAARCRGRGDAALPRARVRRAARGRAARGAHGRAARSDGEQVPHRSGVGAHRDWMLKLKPMAKDERRRRAVAPIARKPTAAAGAVSGGGMSWFLVYTVACLRAHACIQSHTAVACLPRHHLQSLSAGALPGARHLAAYNHHSPASMA